MQKHQWTQTVIGSCLALFVTASWGQQLSPADMGYADQMERQRAIQVQNINQQQNAARNAARQQAWQAK
ncbi:hypothetical protein, partial [Brachymonas sp. M4Q-1]